MIFVTGDTHIPIDVTKLRLFDMSKNLTKNDYVIICGDFGAVWNFKGEDEEEKMWLEWLEKRQFTTLFIDGNHECFPRLNSFPVETWNGGKIHKIKSTVIHLMRGQIFNIDGKKIFTMGGATSHDRGHRKKGETWWEEELPNDTEYSDAWGNLIKNNYEVDYVITHCMPSNIQYRIDYRYKRDLLTDSLFTIDSRIKFRHWYSGHYHIDADIDDCHTVLYDEILELGNSIKGY